MVGDAALFFEKEQKKQRPRDAQNPITDVRLNSYICRVWFMHANLFVEYF